jgi:hypothetical protein
MRLVKTTSGRSFHPPRPASLAFLELLPRKPLRFRADLSAFDFHRGFRKAARSRTSFDSISLRVSESSRKIFCEPFLSALAESSVIRSLMPT